MLLCFFLGGVLCYFASMFLILFALFLIFLIFYRRGFLEFLGFSLPFKFFFFFFGGGAGVVCKLSLTGVFLFCFFCVLFLNFQGRRRV